ncbi:tetratricopeptide repeat protein [Prochlorococcus marinus]|uniref:tetratricopeptide repeat protein n=1 Tax=Prochlorococcus marinus TaxID=1219 RepID=UPI0022B39450|nr:tetratricopeptide repeat protein [Prochlorococcus marinus]
MIERKKDQKQKVPEVKTFAVPFILGEVKENISINLNTPSKPSSEKIIKQAIDFHLKGNINEAAKYYQNLIDQGLKDHRVFYNYGIILQDLGKSQEAEKFYRTAIEYNPSYADAHFNLGNILTEMGKLKEAEISYMKTIELKPNFAESYSNLGTILIELGRLKEAEISFRKGIELNPSHAESYSNLGTILIKLGRLKEAETVTCKAIEINPEYALANYNLGTILTSLDRLEEAEYYTLKAIQINPNLAEAFYNLGFILKILGRFKEAEISIRKSINLNPNFADAFYTLANIQLRKGEYESGLENYEYRFKIDNPSKVHANPKINRIDDRKLNKGEKLLVVTEQGLGDTILFMRYIPYLKKLGIEVSFCAQEKLHTLIKSSGIDPNPLFSYQVDSISEGQWIPLLSLPRYLKVNPKNPIITKPYVSARQELNYKWVEKLSNETLPIIGINWQGNPYIEKGFYAGRSIPLETFGTILKKNNIKFLSLQKGYGSEQLKHCSFRKHFVACQDEIDSILDFEEHAAIINSCDLVISNDSCAATLAASMGKKVCLLMKNISFWAWGIKGDSTFWYPSMRLFRQNERNNWEEVMERVSTALKEEMEVEA